MVEQVARAELQLWRGDERAVDLDWASSRGVATSLLRRQGGDEAAPYPGGSNIAGHAT